MPLLPTLSYSALSGLSGWFIGNQINGRQQRLQVQEFQDEILAEINERYDAYMELEARVSRAIKQFDLEEERSRREIERKEQRILELEASLDRSVDQAHAEGGALTALESALGNFLAESGVVPVEDALGRRDLEGEMQQLRGELARSTGEKDRQILSQEALIGQLSESVARFEAGFDSSNSSAASVLEAPVGMEIGDALDGAFGGGEGWMGVDDALAETSISEPVDATEIAGQALGRSIRVEDDATRAAQREELEGLRERVAALAPYVERLAEADQRIEHLEACCDQLSEARDDAVNGLQARVAELETERLVELERAREKTAEPDAQRLALEERVQELAPLAERLQEREEACERLESQVAGLAPLAGRVEASEQAREELERQVTELAPLVARLEESDAACQQLEAAVAELTPMAERVRELELGRTRLDKEQAARVRALEAQVAQLEVVDHGKQPEVEAYQQQLIEMQQALELAQGKLVESEAQVVQLDRRCESIRRKKDEQLDVLRDRVNDLEVVREELDQKQVELGELEERCSALERSKRRAATTTRRLREELAETEEVVRETGGDPAEMRRERAARRKQLMEIFAELDGVVEGIKSQEGRFEAMDGAHNDALIAQEREIDGLEERLRDLYLLVETVEDVVAQLEPKA